MATTTFASNNAGIVFGGKWGAPLALGWAVCSTRDGVSSEVRFIATGTECKIGMAVVSGPITLSWSVDGGATQTDSVSAGPPVELVTLFTALSDAAHEVRVWIDNNDGTIPAIDTEAFLEVTGAVPALTAPTGYTTNQYAVSGTTGIAVDSSVNSGKFIQGVFPSVQGYTNLVSRGGIRFKATTAIIRVWILSADGSSPITLFTDGDHTSPVTASRTGWGWVSFTGLDDTAEHTYRLCIGGYSTQNLAYSIMLPNGTLNTTALSTLPLTFFQGDSTTDGSATDDHLNFPVIYSIMNDRAWIIDGYVSQRGGVEGITYKGNPGDTGANPTEVIYMWGINDEEQAVAVADWNAAIDQILAQVTADLPDAKIIWGGLPATASTSGLAYNVESIIAVDDLADADVEYGDPTSLGTLATADGFHYTAASNQLIANWLTAMLHPAIASPVSMAAGMHNLSGGIA
jgi:hypothetical protein